MRVFPRSFVLAALLGVGLLLSACSKKPSEDQCEAFADHFVKLLQESRDKPDARIRKLAQGQRQSVVDACVKDGTAAEVECVLGQASIGDIEANCK